MVGFAVMSFPENKWGGLVSQGIGTSMLQMGNIVKNPKNLDRTDPYFRYYRTDRNLSLPYGNERSCCFFRYGYLWSGWSDRRVYRLGQRRF